MPIFNLETSVPNLDTEFLKLLSETNYLFSYSTVSIIEIKWIIIQLAKKGEIIEELEKQFSESLGALRNNNRFKEITMIDPLLNDVSYVLTKLGHKDYFDTVIASSALWEADMFITQDKELVKRLNLLIRKKLFSMLSPILLLNWNQFKNNEKNISNSNNS